MSSVPTTSTSDRTGPGMSAENRRGPPRRRRSRRHGWRPHGGPAENNAVIPRTGIDLRVGERIGRRHVEGVVAVVAPDEGGAVDLAEEVKVSAAGPAVDGQGVEAAVVVDGLGTAGGPGGGDGVGPAGRVALDRDPPAADRPRMPERDGPAAAEGDIERVEAVDAVDRRRPRPSRRRRKSRRRPCP